MQFVSQLVQTCLNLSLMLEYLLKRALLPRTKLVITSLINQSLTMSTTAQVV